jgi:hypothetical protein
MVGDAHAEVKRNIPKALHRHSLTFAASPEASSAESALRLAKRLVLSVAGLGFRTTVHHLLHYGIVISLAYMGCLLDNRSRDHVYQLERLQPVLLATILT